MTIRTRSLSSRWHLRVLEVYSQASTTPTPLLNDDASGSSMPFQAPAAPAAQSAVLPSS